MLDSFTTKTLGEEDPPMTTHAEGEEDETTTTWLGEEEQGPYVAEVRGSVFGRF
jgi:hypothetical protein